jgi:hypothetical protein
MSIISLNKLHYNCTSVLDGRDNMEHQHGTMMSSHIHIITCIHHLANALHTPMHSPHNLTSSGFATSAAENLVGTTPGATQFTVMPSGPSSAARPLVSPSKAVLLTAYMAMGAGGLLESTEIVEEWQEQQQQQQQQQHEAGQPGNQATCRRRNVRSTLMSDYSCGKLHTD